jgi:hypothetical protein
MHFLANIFKKDRCTFWPIFSKKKDALFGQNFQKILKTLPEAQRTQGIQSLSSVKIFQLE